MTETFELIKKAKNGDEDACEKILENNTPLIWSIVRRFLGRGVDSDDLYQLGCLGLLKAIYGFDENLGYQFSTYAVPKISGEIRRFLRDDGTIKVSRTMKERAAKVKHFAEKLLFDLNREPSISEIAEACGLSIEDVAQAECATSITESLNREIGDDGQTLEDKLGTIGIEEKTLEYIALSDAISKLNQRERTVIMLRYFKCLTQHQSARIMRISQVQVSRIERNAISKLKSNID